MTSLRASVPVLRDRFGTTVNIPFGEQAEWPEFTAMFQANGWMFCADEFYLYASSNGVNFLPIYKFEPAGKLMDVAYGDGTYVFVGENLQILTSGGPDEYFNWNLQVQTPAEVPAMDDFM